MTRKATGNGSHLCKITLGLDPNAWHGHATETVWAEPVGRDRYRLRSVPFYAKGLSIEDVVNTEPDTSIVIGVSLRSGHSTYRIFLAENLDDTSEAFQSHWRNLAAMSCSYERATGRLFAVDVPPRADIQKVFELLALGERDGVWDFDEGHCGHC